MKFRFAGWMWPLLILGGLLVVAWSLVWGAPVSALDLWSGHPDKAEVARRIFLELRPPRVVAGLLVGASLSVAGAGLQSVFRNPLAEPYLLGISAGGALGATLAFALRIPLFFGFDASVPLAFVGALASAFAVYSFGSRTSSPYENSANNNRARLLLVGVALSAFLSALMSLVVTLSGRAELVQQASFWLLGGLSRATWAQNGVLALALGMGLALLLSSARDLNALRAGDEDAASLGVDLVALNRKILVAASLLSAASVAAAGLIGFVGLLAPHMVRLLGARDIRALLPGTAFLGAILLCGCDTLARGLFAPIEIPVGIITAILGVPLFMSLARKM